MTYAGIEMDKKYCWLAMMAGFIKYQYLNKDNAIILRLTLENLI